MYAPVNSGFFFKEDVRPDPQDLIAKKLTAQESLEVAKRILAVLESLDAVDHETAEPPLRDLVAEMGLKAGQVFGNFTCGLLPGRP